MQFRSTAHPSDLVAAQDQLRAAITEAIKADFSPDNPITHARGRAEFADHATEPMKLLMAEVVACAGGSPEWKPKS